MGDLMCNWHTVILINLAKFGGDNFFLLVRVRQAFGVILQRTCKNDTKIVFVHFHPLTSSLVYIFLFSTAKANGKKRLIF